MLMLVLVTKLVIRLASNTYVSTLQSHFNASMGAERSTIREM